MVPSDKRRARLIRNGARISSIPVLIGAGECRGNKGKNPVARLIEAGDGSGRIEVQCACGRKIILECEYDKPLPNED